MNPENIEPLSNVRPISKEGILYFKKHLKKGFSLNYPIYVIKSETKENLYYCIDGMHRILASIELIKENHNFNNPEGIDSKFIPVSILQNISIIQQYSIAVSLNETSQICFKTTIYDRIYGMRKFIERLINEGMENVF